jgi:formamidopyrimidine-DNA glycosylase
MPEGHSLHRLARDMAELVGPVVSASSPQGRFAAESIDGQRLAGIEAYGKNLLIEVADGVSVHVHLGMRGKWLRFAPVIGPVLPQVRLRLAAPDVAWDLIAPSRCELLDTVGRDALIAGLGPDPLRPDADADRAFQLVSAHPGTIGAALLDQSRIAGVGNVFRAEVLHGMGMAPTRPAHSVTAEEFAQLWARLQAMMSRAVEDGRIITVDAADRPAVPEAEARRVYKREHCYDCGTPVVTGTIDGRTTYACPRCQPEWAG